jgi:hypothetical protein
METRLNSKITAINHDDSFDLADFYRRFNPIHERMQMTNMTNTITLWDETSIRRIQLLPERRTR